MSVVSPPIGWPVQYLINDCADQRMQVAAVVTESGANGVVTLAMLYPHADAMKPKSGVHHTGDDWCVQFADMLKKPGNGTWRYIPGMEYVEPGDEAEAMRDEGLRRVEELHHAGNDPVQISKKVRRFGLSKDDVVNHVETLA